MTSISPISTHHYIPKLLGVGQIVEYTFPKPVKEAIQEHREYQRIHNGILHLGNKLDIIV
tara:strand:+ start:5432 stop:5611 length:180 start_codon:yes stop_codon:yes gene_type:complete